ncbi:MAG: hypothetical protein ETSY2_50670, partial [Candidatus Entotheonella gemina]
MENKSALLLVTLIILSVVLTRLIFFLTYPADGPVGRRGPDGRLSIARNLVSGQGYIFDDGTQTANRTPVGVYFFALALLTMGDSLWSIVIAQWLAEVGTAILVFFIALEIFQHRGVAFVSSLLLAFYVPSMAYTIRSWSEPLFTLLLAAFTWYLLWSLRAPSMWRFILCGACLALATLSRPVMQYYPVVVLLLMVWALDKPWGHIGAYFAAFCVGFALVLSPWVVRNYQVFGVFIPSSTNSGLSFYQGNYMLGESDYLRYRQRVESMPALKKTLESHFGTISAATDLAERTKAKDLHGYEMLAEYAKAKGLNEYEINRFAQQEATRVIRAFPLRYAIVSSVRFFRLWFSQMFVQNLFQGRVRLMPLLIASANVMLLGFAMVGWVRYGGSWCQRAAPLVAMLAYHTILYTMVLALGRYRAPIMPYVLIFAAYTL